MSKTWPNEIKPIFIVGCERSGTTLLRAMVNAHPNIAIPYESHRFSKMVSVSSPWEHVWTKRQVSAPIEEFLSHPKVSYWGLEVNAVLRELNVAELFRYADVLRAIYEAYARREGKRRWGDKTPINTFELPQLIVAFPDAQFVHIVRDGRDVYLSWSNVDWVRYDATTAAKRWRKFVQTAHSSGKQLSPERYFELRYEDLVQDPPATLRTLCRFLKEPFSERMLQYNETQGLVPEQEQKTFHRLLSAPPDVSRAYVWRRQAQQGDIVAFERIAGSVLIECGYGVRFTTQLMLWMNTYIERVKGKVKSLLLWVKTA